jgi:hypothetical protein
MNYDELFPSKYLKASDIGEHRPLVVIHRITVEELGKGDNKERKPVAWFRGKDKGMVLNKTNATTISKVAGSKDMDKWPGTRLQLFVAEVEAFGELTEAIRLRRAPDPSVAAPAAEEPFDAEAEAMKATFDDDSVPF